MPAVTTPKPNAKPATSAAPASPVRPAEAPTIRRRIACMLYEGVLLFGVLSASTGVYLLARPALQQLGLDGPFTMQCWSFLVLGCYFVWFWQRNGQTLAMQTWRMRVETAAGVPPRWPQATLRYLLAWLWLPPSAALGHALGLVKGPFVGVLCAGLLAWILLALLDPRRQFLHDRLARTRLTDLRPPKP
ncbi:RDD family protein [Cupriavidus basilensis]|uniref:RDD family protein n=1 Tax=Cupriavidus basilensis TaxID=68895 RepID=UPI0020A6B3B7|nr:RDD family protein [Cupriavidus basilensis]MCP3024310.1 RDD family protein [Cupriavidus basilensis]MDR3384605.1 RDD family protein [Cupriavidus basilensis]